MSELSLGDAITETVEEVSVAEAITDTPDTGERPDPESFDLGEWANGVRPVRRAVRVLLANDEEIERAPVRIREIADRIDILPDGDEVDALIDEAIGLQEMLRGDLVEMVAHSAERIRADGKRLVDELGLKKNDDGLVESGDAQILTYYLAAEQIVSPKLTGAQLVELAKVRRGEAEKIIILGNELNSKSITEAPELSINFTRRRSGRR